MTPTHSKRGAIRYRYYVGRRLIEDGRDAAPTLRIPAQELEDAVVQAIMSFLGDDSGLLRSLGNIDAAPTEDVLHRAKEMLMSLRTWSAERLKECVERISVGADKIAITVRMKTFRKEHTEDDPPVVIEVPMQMKRCGQAVRLVIDAPEASPRRSPDAKLITLLARAHDWFGRLNSGQDEQVSAIAAEEGFSASYVTRVIYLAFLAPDIVRRIVKGDHAPDFGTDRMMRMVPLPLDWAEQRVLLGFDG